jgi:hypothetical protein
VGGVAELHGSAEDALVTGTIETIEHVRRVGFIRGEDGLVYGFTLAAFVKPTKWHEVSVGQDVTFDGEDGLAHRILLVTP